MSNQQFKDMPVEYVIIQNQRVRSVDLGGEKFYFSTDLATFPKYKEIRKKARTYKFKAEGTTKVRALISERYVPAPAVKPVAPEPVEFIPYSVQTKKRCKIEGQAEKVENLLKWRGGTMTAAEMLKLHNITLPSLIQVSLAFPDKFEMGDRPARSTGGVYGKLIRLKEEKLEEVTAVEETVAVVDELQPELPLAAVESTAIVPVTEKQAENVVDKLALSANPSTSVVYLPDEQETIRDAMLRGQIRWMVEYRATESAQASGLPVMEVRRNMYKTLYSMFDSLMVKRMGLKNVQELAEYNLGVNFIAKDGVSYLERIQNAGEMHTFFKLVESYITVG